MSNKTEIRTLAMSLRASPRGDSFEINGTAATYGVLSTDLDGYREKLQPGCFARSLQSGSDVKATFNHSPDQILGRTSNRTLTLWDGPQSLNFLCKLNPASQMHRDLHSSIQRRDISECSFAMIVEDDAWSTEKDESGQSFNCRTVKQAKLVDVSAVTTPAYLGNATSVVARSSVVVPPQPMVNAAPLRMTTAVVKKLSRQTGRSFEDILFGYSPKVSVDRWNRMKLDAITDVVMRAKKDAEDDLEDDDSDWNERKHERAATKHRTQAQRSTLEKGVQHYYAADLNDYAAQHFNRYNSRAARRASEKANAMPLSEVS
jgi:HK97 family phage prohead protease